MWLLASLGSADLRSFFFFSGIRHSSGMLPPNLRDRVAFGALPKGPKKIMGINPMPLL